MKFIKNKHKQKTYECDKCGVSSRYTKIYSKTNYPFGKKSKGVTTYICKKCKIERNKK